MRKFWAFWCSVFAMLGIFFSVAIADAWNEEQVPADPSTMYVITDSNVNVRLNPYVEFMEGEEDAEWPWDLPDTGWQTNSDYMSSCSVFPEIADKTYWYHVTIANRSADERNLVLSVNNIFVKYLSVYVIGPNGALSRVWHTGMKSGARKIFPSAGYSFPINFLDFKDGKTELYIRVKSDQDYRLDLRLQDLRSFSHHDAEEKIVNAVITGFMLLVSIFSLIMFFLLREKRYLAYNLFAMGILANLLITGSYSSLFLSFLNHLDIARLYTCFCFVTLWGIQLISLEYLSNAKWTVLKYISRTFGLFFVCSAVVVWFCPGYFASILFFFGTAVMFLLTLVWVLYAVMKRNSAHLIYSLAQLAFLFGCIFPYVCTYGMLGWSKYAIYDFFLISISAAIMISASLIYRFYKEKNYNRNVTLKAKMSRRQFVNFFSLTNEGMFKADVDGRILNINPALCRVLGYRNVSEISRSGKTNIKHLCADEDSQKIYGNSVSKLIQKYDSSNRENGDGSVLLLEGSIDNIKLRFVSSEGCVIHVSMSIRLSEENNDSFSIIGDVKDISGDENLKKQIHYMEYHDQNTGAFNRKYMIGLLESIFNDAGDRRVKDAESRVREQDNTEQGGKDYLCFIHVNNLKYIRDTVGHQHADRLLRQISEYLQNHLPENSCLICLNNDEFAVVMRGVYIVLNTVKAWIKDIADMRYESEGFIYNVTTDCGIVDMSIVDNDVSVLLSYADAACRNAHAQGPNQCILCCEKSDRILTSRKSVALSTSVWQAIETNSVMAVKIPMLGCDGSSAASSRCEYVVRIRNSKGQFVDVSEFRDETSDFNLMSHLDVWLVDNLVRQNDSGVLGDVNRILVTIHSETLCDNYRADAIYRALSGKLELCSKLYFQFDTERLEDRLQQLERFIGRFSSLGVGFALRDFVGNRISIEVLEKFPINCVQVSEFYTKELVRNSVNWKIAKSEVSMIKSLNMETVAAGVNNADQYEIVRDLGFDFCKGEYSGKFIKKK
ncbi:EAL domain-containing protein [uncultured Ruminobacter sp.]|uniref:EAL domain-containing protein n=1 Tax=uncultured Ruminobacter sp. TaxID=538947 RepID=UPI0025DDEB35|nr:EAL domain-containing protein [uncultured Ruminobacter sp.]